MRIEGMTGSGCAERVEAILCAVPGVVGVDVCTTSAVARISVSESTSFELLAQSLRTGGYSALRLRRITPASVIDIDDSIWQRREREGRQAVIQAVFMWGLPIVCLEWAGPHLASSGPGSTVWWRALQAVLCALALYSPAGGPIVACGIRGLWFHRVNADVLLFIAIVLAYVTSVAAIFVDSWNAFNFVFIAVALAAVNVGRWIETVLLRRAHDGSATTSGVLDDERLIALVHRAQARRSELEVRGERMANVLALVALAMAGCVTVGWGLGAGRWTHGLGCALAILAVASPTALNTAAPVLFAALRDAAFDGVICASSACIIRLARIEAVVFLRETVPPAYPGIARHADGAARGFAHSGVRCTMVVDQVDDNVRAAARHSGFVDVVAHSTVERHMNGLGSACAEVASLGHGPAELHNGLRLGVMSVETVDADACDVGVVDGDLSHLPDARHIACRALATVRTNLSWAWCYNVVAVFLAAIGVVTPWLAPVLMMLCGVGQVANTAQRPRRFSDGAEV